MRTRPIRRAVRLGFGKMRDKFRSTSERGQALALIALALPVLLGCVGLGVDFGRLAAQQRKLQDYADSAALSGAQDLVGTYSSQACTDANATLSENSNPATASCATSDTGKSGAQNTVTVTLTQALPLDFMPVLGMSKWTLTAKGRATNKSVNGCNDNLAANSLCAPYAAWRPSATSGCPDQWVASPAADTVGMTVVIRDNGWSGTVGATNCGSWNTNSNNFKGYLRPSGSDLYIGTNSITTKGGNACGQEPVSQIQAAATAHENLVIPVIDSSNGNGSNINIDIPYFVTVSFDFTYPYTNQVQSVSLNGPPTSGNFKLTYGGKTTGNIPYNETAANVQADLAALSSIGSGNVTVSGQNGGPYTIIFGGTMSMSSIGAITSTSSLSGGTSPAISIAQTATNTSKSGTASSSSDFTCPATWWVKVVDTPVTSGQAVDTTGDKPCNSVLAGTCQISLLPCDAVSPCP
jgi:Flp pilus assembly protein TadG